MFYAEDFLGILSIILIVFALVDLPVYEYEYVDINDKIGTSKRCLTTDFFYCDILEQDYIKRIQVKEYSIKVVDKKCIYEFFINWVGGLSNVKNQIQNSQNG